jgi:hypothetical protein
MISQENIGTLDRIHARIRACAEECEKMMQMPGTSDGELNAAIATLSATMQATKYVSANALRQAKRYERIEQAA